MIVVDTSVLVRFFTGDDTSKATQAAQLLESPQALLIPDVVFIELDYVLQTLYDASRGDLFRAYQFLLSQKNISVSLNMQKAVDMYSATSLSIADCMLAQEALKGKLASFDKKLLAFVGPKRYWK